MIRRKICRAPCLVLVPLLPLTFNFLSRVVFAVGRVPPKQLLRTTTNETYGGPIYDSSRLDYISG